MGNTNDLDSVCSPHIVGKSKIYQIVNDTTVIIGVPLLQPILFRWI